MRFPLLVMLICTASTLVGQPVRLVTDFTQSDVEESSEPGFLMVFGNGAAFTTEVEGDSRLLWYTDGTSVVSLGEIGGSGSIVHRSAGNKLYFLMGPYNTPTLMVTDGTPSGTSAVDTTELNGGISFLGIIDEVLIVRDAQTRIWAVDGTSTTLLTDALTPYTNIESVELGDEVLFHNLTRMWRTDGTVAGTVAYHDFGIDPNVDLYRIGDAIYLMGGDVWRTDGREVIHLGQNDFGLIEAPTPLGSSIVYRSGFSVYISDGVPGEQTLLMESGRQPLDILSDGTHVFFRAGDDTTGHEWWRSDGTPEGTEPMGELVPGPVSPAIPAWMIFDGRLTFFFDNKIWQNDGTLTGTRVVADLGDVTREPGLFSVATSPAGVLFNGRDAEGDIEPYRYDGNTVSLLADLYPLDNGSTVFNSFGFADGLLYLHLGSPEPGVEGVWSTTGEPWTTVLTYPTLDANAGTYFRGAYYTSVDSQIEPSGLFVDDGDPSGPVRLTDTAHDSMYFLPIGDEIAFLEKHEPFNSFDSLIFSDGTPEGTDSFYVKGVDLSEEHSFWLEDRLYFLNRFPLDTYFELWSTDLTVAGSRMELNSSFQLSELTRFAGKWFVVARVTNQIGRELCVLDTDPIGVTLVSDVEPGPFSHNPRGLTVVGDRLFFLTDTALRLTDGTPGGTRTVTALPEFTEHQMVALDDDVLIFRLDDQLWRSLGSAEDTYPFLSDLDDLEQLTVHRGVLYFTAVWPDTGIELIRSDGTIPGTYPVADLWTGPLGSEPRDLHSLGGQLFFSARADHVGRELFVLCEEPEGTIALDGSVCIGGVDYRARVAGAGPGAFYDWQVHGGTITAGTGTREIVFSPSGSGPVTLSVVIDVPGGCGTTGSLEILPQGQVPSPVDIQGSEVVCSGEVYVYSVADAVDTVFDWAVPVGAEIISGQGTARVEVLFGANGGMLSVQPVNSCGAGSLDGFEVALDGTTDIADAGPNQIVCGLETTLAAVPVSSGNWEIVSGIGGQLTDPSDPTTTFAGLAEQAYQLRWRVDNGNCGIELDTTYVTFYTEPGPANAGEDQAVCGNNTQVVATMTESGVGRWEQVSGPQTLPLSDPYNRVQYLYVNQAYGTYVLRWTVGNGVCPDMVADEVRITFHRRPGSVTSAGSDQMLAITETATLDASTAPELTGTWSVIDGPLSESGQFSDVTDPGAVFTPLGGIGVYTLAWTVPSGSCDSAVETVRLSFDTVARTPRPFSVIDNTYLSRELDGFLYFSKNYTGLWRTDGTIEGSEQVATIPNSRSASPMLVLGNKLFFTVSDSSDQYLMCTDGSSEGTVLLKKDTRVSRYVGLGDRFLFFEDPFNGADEPWITDGTPEGTRLIATLGSSSLNQVEYLVSTGETAYFVFDNPETGRSAVWRTDGTEQGTRLLIDDPSFGDTSPRHLTVAGGRLFFTAGDAELSSALWVSDGTSEGTRALVSIRDDDSHGILSMQSLGDAVFFLARAENNGPILPWVSDGTVAGTQILSMELEGIWPENDTVFGAHVYWRTDLGNDRQGLARSDGTVAGTETVYSGSITAISQLTALNDEIFFRAWDEDHGRELWVTDGTAGGTELVRDIVIGPEGSEPTGFKAFAGALYFGAYQVDDPDSRITHKLDPGAVLRESLLGPTVVCPAGDYRVRMTGATARNAWTWSVLNGDLLSGQGTDEITFAPRSAGAVVISVDLSGGARSPQTLEISIPILRWRPEIWTDRGEVGTDLDGNGRVDIRDLITVNDTCR